MVRVVRLGRVHALQRREARRQLAVPGLVEGEVVGGEEEVISVGVVQVHRRRGLAVEVLDRLLPAGDEVAADLHVAQPLDGDSTPAAQAPADAAHHLGRLDRGEGARVGADQERFAPVVRDAGQHGVFLALENHGGLTTTLDGLLRLIGDVKSPWFGVNLDTGNFHSADPYADLARIASYAVNVQVKVSMNPGGGKKEPADFRRLAKILTDSGYRGYVVLEYEEREDPRQACPRHIDELRAAFA
ncbi:MAG: hypothetical protein B7Z73_19100 [Planctomycetia bacterium 21-64-5]|nr:MAG: hypothetical protein B7Z73_19100 [Planctomycetia bacterium 21-64-5]